MGGGAGEGAEDEGEEFGGEVEEEAVVLGDGVCGEELGILDKWWKELRERTNVLAEGELG